MQIIYSTCIWLKSHIDISMKKILKFHIDMGSWRVRLLLLVFISQILIIINLRVFTVAQPDFFSHFCINSGNYTTNSTYQTNLNTLLSSVSSGVDSYGFYSNSVVNGGQNSDTVNAIVLCRGDVGLDTCRGCVSNATIKLVQDCPNNKEAIGWYDQCMLRYSNRSIRGILSEDPAVYAWNINNATSKDQFNNALQVLLDSLRTRAISGGSFRKFAADHGYGPDFQTIFALVQCTPDLSQEDCSNCLVKAFTQIPQYSGGKQGGRALKPSCNFRFESYSFFNEIPSGAPPPGIPTGAPPSGHGHITTRTVIVIVVSTMSSLVIIIVCLCIFSRKRKQRKPRQRFEIEMSEATDEITTVESLQYDFDTIRVATDNFSQVNKLGQGGFGAVYRGRLLNGQEIAVKRLSKDSGQGDLEFKNEVMLVAKLQHRNLARLLGFCLEGTERLLIYEFVTNSSLDHFIFDPIKGAQLDWERRYKIIGGIARGLLYLHEDSRLRIIHRDLKASNVLLDAEMNPKISDFGMARLFVLDETQGNTSRIVGTYGYMAPEYAMHGNFSVKSDVFSFGVLVLEIVSGQKNHCFRNRENVDQDLVSYAWKSWRDGTASNMIDSTMRSGSGSVREMMRCIHIGLLCVQDMVADRPTMASVVLMLSSFSLTLPLPSEPAFFLHRSVDSELPNQPLITDYKKSGGITDSSGWKSKSNHYSRNDSSITEVYPR